MITKFDICLLLCQSFSYVSATFPVSKSTHITQCNYKEQIPRWRPRHSTADQRRYRWSHQLECHSDNASPIHCV